MGCCGCSLYASTITAGIFTLIDCLLFLTFDIFIIIFITSTDEKDWSSDIKLNATANGFTKLGEGTDTTVEVLVGFRIALRFIWFISAFALFRGNSKEHRKFLYGWELLTVTRIIFSVATSIYALVKFTEDLGELFKKDTKWEDKEGKYAAEFVIVINFLELGPIWLIIFIALVIFVHQRGLEIKRKKSQINQVNNWGSINLKHDYKNGHSNNKTSQLNHPLSLTQEPNPLSISNLEETHSSKVSTLSSVEPILKINEVITIPRVRTLTPPKDYNVKANIHSFENKALERKISNRSALAKRSSYLFNDSGRDPSKIPKRNHSYNYGQKSENYAYDNRAYQRTNNDNNDLYRPVSIKRASAQKY